MNLLDKLQGLFFSGRGSARLGRRLYDILINGEIKRTAKVVEKRESAKRNALIYNISRGENCGKLRIFVSVSGAWRGRSPFSECATSTCAVGNSALLPPCPSFAAHPPWANRRPAVAAQFPRSTAQKKRDICTDLRDYALKAAAQHIKHRGKSASTGRIAQYDSQFFIEKSPTPPVKTAHFRTKVPVFRPFSGRCDTICAKSTF